MGETTRDVEGLLEQIESMVDGDYSEETEGDIDFTVCTACGGSPAQHYEDPPCPTGMLEEAAAEIRRLRSELEGHVGALRDQALTNAKLGRTLAATRAELERRDAALREAFEAGWRECMEMPADLTPDVSRNMMLEAWDEWTPDENLATGGDDE